MEATGAPTRWGTPEEKERRRRITVAHAAYAYECMDDPIMSDTRYDALAESIDPRMSTGHAVLDTFFREEFTPMTGMWIRDHPEIEGIERLYRRYKRLVREM